MAGQKGLGMHGPQLLVEGSNGEVIALVSARGSLYTLFMEPQELMDLKVAIDKFYEGGKV